MAMTRAMLDKRRGNKSVDDWAYEITEIVGKEHRIKTATLHSYLNGTRNITGKGAKSLAVYFYKRGDFEMVDALTQVTLGIPYPRPSS